MKFSGSDFTTTVDEILSVVSANEIGPGGFGGPQASEEWRSLNANDCREQVERCRAWIRTQDRTKTIRPGIWSEDYMRTVERHANHHIQKGAFLAAAYLEGVRVKRYGSDANFNIRINRHRNVL
jgi:hypothetical protein